MSLRNDHRRLIALALLAVMAPIVLGLPSAGAYRPNDADGGGCTPNTKRPSGGEDVGIELPEEVSEACNERDSGGGSPPPCTPGPSAAAGATGSYTVVSASVSANCVQGGKYKGVSYGHSAYRTCGDPRPSCPHTSTETANSGCGECSERPYARTTTKYGQFWDATHHPYTDAHAYARL